MNKSLILLFLYLFFLQSFSFAGQADVIKVDARKLKNNTYSFNVTISHGDTGWKHYADKWDIMSKDGTIFGTRILYHPHVNEQPFTRSLAGVEIPEKVKTVFIRAHDSVHKYGGKVVTVELP